MTGRRGVGACGKAAAPTFLDRLPFRHFRQGARPSFVFLCCVEQSQVRTDQAVKIQHRRDIARQSRVFRLFCLGNDTLQKFEPIARPLFQLGDFFRQPVLVE
ncbi:MAG: hypothetical protein KBA51_05625 [Kiritimatiellae bacterium]|nr:hypothetical protein [Kiritimatiellia bacterium]